MSKKTGIITGQIAGLCLGFMALCSAHADCEETPPEREAYVVKDYETGRILLAKDADVLIQPASMTKMMTALLAYEALADGFVSLDDKVNIPQKMVRNHGAYNGAPIHYVSGWKTAKFEDVLKGVMLRSYNDLAVATAMYIAQKKDIGDAEGDFVRLMNERAQEIGLQSTFFVNASGWPKDQYIAQDFKVSEGDLRRAGSTVNDMSMLLFYIVGAQPKLRDIMGKKSDWANGFFLETTNTLMLSKKFAYAVIANKSGYSCASGSALSLLVEGMDGHRFLMSYVGAKSRWARDIKITALLDKADDILDKEEEDQRRKDSEIKECLVNNPAEYCIF